MLFAHFSISPALLCTRAQKIARAPVSCFTHVKKKHFLGLKATSHTRIALEIGFVVLSRILSNQKFRTPVDRNILYNCIFINTTWLQMGRCCLQSEVRNCLTTLSSNFTTPTRLDLKITMAFSSEMRTVSSSRRMLMREYKRALLICRIRSSQKQR